MADNTGTAVAKAGEVAPRTNSLIEKYGEFQFSEEQQQEQEAVLRPLVTNIDRVLTVNGMLKYYNKFVKEKNESVQTSINYARFAKIVDKLEGMPNEIKLLYTDINKHFDKQQDELIDYFKRIFAPKTVDKLSIPEKRKLLAKIVEEAVWEIEGVIAELSPSRIGLALLSYIYPIDAKRLGITQKQKLSNINTYAVNEIFNHIARNAGFEVGENKEQKPNENKGE